MKVREIVGEIVTEAQKRNKGRKQYFYTVVRSPGFDSSGFPVGEERVDQYGLTVDEDGFRKSISVPGDFMSIPGDLFIAAPNIRWVSRRAGNFWHSEKEEYAPASLDLWRIDWDDERGDCLDWIKIIEAKYPYRGFSLDGDANEEEEKKIRETLEELFRINEEYDGEEANVKFLPFIPRLGDEDGIDGYSFETSDPEYLRGELNDFRGTAFGCSCKFDLYVMSEESAEVMKSVCIDENTSDKEIDGICERFRDSDDICVMCNSVKAGDIPSAIPF